MIEQKMANAVEKTKRKERAKATEKTIKLERNHKKDNKMTKEQKIKKLLGKYLNRKYDVIRQYFNGLPAGPVVAKKMENLTGLPAKWFRRPGDYGVFPFHYCLLNYDEIVLKLNNMGYWED